MIHFGYWIKWLKENRPRLQLEATSPDLDGDTAGSEIEIYKSTIPGGASSVALFTARTRSTWRWVSVFDMADLIWLRTVLTLVARSSAIS